MIDPEVPAWPVRAPMGVETDGAGPGAAGGTVSRLLARMGRSAFQARKLGEAFETWRWMIDRGCLIAMGLAGSMASAGLGPLVTWLVERGYVDLVVSTSANATEDLLEARGVPFYQVDPDHVDDRELLTRGYYRFYDHVVSAREYDRMEEFTRGFFEHLARSWPEPTIAGVRFVHELGRWLDGQGLHGPLAATCFRHGVPLFVPAAPDGPLSEGYRTAARKGPTVDFFRDYEITIDVMGRFMPPGPGTAAIFVGGGVPKDFIQITATLAMPGIACFRYPRRLPSSSGPRTVTPVMFAPGRARLAMSPLRTGSPADAMTIGIVVVARLAANALGVTLVTMMSTFALTSSVARPGSRSSRPSAHRYSSVMLRPSS